MEPRKRRYCECLPGKIPPWAYYRVRCVNCGLTRKRWARRRGGRFVPKPVDRELLEELGRALDRWIEQHPIPPPPKAHKPRWVNELEAAEKRGYIPNNEEARRHASWEERSRGWRLWREDEIKKEAIKTFEEVLSPFGDWKLRRQTRRKVFGCWRRAWTIAGWHQRKIPRPDLPLI